MGKPAFVAFLTTYCVGNLIGLGAGKTGKLDRLEMQSERFWWTSLYCSNQRGDVLRTDARHDRYVRLLSKPLTLAYCTALGQYAYPVVMMFDTVDCLANGVTANA